jgi:hypothetical protein
MIELRRRQMLAGGAGVLGALMLGGRGAEAAIGAKKNLVIVFAGGGWDTTYAIDPKPGSSMIDAPSGDVQELRGIPILTDPARPSVTEFFSDFGDITTVVNGIQTQSISHLSGALRIMTGSSSSTNPDIGTIAAVEFGSDLGAPYLVLGATSYSGAYAAAATRTGTANQLGTLLRPETGFPFEDGTVVTQRYLPARSEQDLVRAHVLTRAQVEIDARGQLGRNASRMDDFVESMDRADLLKEIGTLEGFSGTRSLADQMALAVDALDANMSQAVQMEMTGFDTHVGNEQQGPLWNGLCADLHGLLTLLDQRSLLEKTVVVVLSEMGRTPKLNAEMGKDHWPVTSAMVIGTELDGGRVIGGTNASFASKNVNLATGEIDPDGMPLRHSTFAAGILEAVGVDPEAWLPAVTPIRL